MKVWDGAGVKLVNPYLTSCTVCSRDIKTKSSENDQATGHFQSFFDWSFSELFFLPSESLI